MEWEFKTGPDYLPIGFRKFLASGAKLKITVMFRGREMSRKEAGAELIKRVTGILEDVAKIDKAASLEGRRMSIILSPR